VAASITMATTGLDNFKIPSLNIMVPNNLENGDGS
jgi:hypothetical protein